MTEKILFYYRMQILCTCIGMVCFSATMLLFVRFQIYRIFQKHRKPNIKKNDKKEEIHEQTIRMSDVQTLELKIFSDNHSTDRNDWLQNSGPGRT